VKNYWRDNRDGGGFDSYSEFDKQARGHNPKTGDKR
jgi:hypothetical protein